MDKETITQTEAIFVHHTQSLFGGKLEDVLSDYTEESVLFTPNGIFKGLAGMREFFGNAIKDMPADWVKNFTMVRQDVEGETVYILWKLEPFVPLSTDTFILHKGKIIVQTIYTPS